MVFSRRRNENVIEKDPTAQTEATGGTSRAAVGCLPLQQRSRGRVSVDLQERSGAGGSVDTFMFHFFILYKSRIGMSQRAEDQEPASTFRDWTARGRTSTESESPHCA